MQKIKYYDEIKGEKIEVEVTAEVAQAMLDINNQERKQRNMARKNELSLDAVEGGENLLIDSTDNPLDILIKKEEIEEKNRKQANRTRLVKKGMKTLNEKERSVVEHIFWKNYTQAELSRKLDVSRGTIKYRYDCAIKKLKAFILKEENGKYEN